MGRLGALSELAACLRGEPPRGCDWPAVVALANQSLTTPQLAAAVLRTRDQPPAKIAVFLDEVLDRNRERNRRLWRQLMEALDALNARGVVPVALKGAALWLWSGDASDRLLSDLDLLVEPAATEAAIAALEGAGFHVARRQTGPLAHVVAELGRPHDPGYVDLHQRPPGPPGLIELADFPARYREIEVEGRRVRVPDAAAQILHLVLHDQFHDGGFWRGGFDLRHSWDVARLAAGLSEADRGWTDHAAGTRLVRDALAAQLMSAERLSRLTGAAGRASAKARFTAWRWRMQFAHPALRLPLAALALALQWSEVREHRQTDRRGRRGLQAPGVAVRPRLADRPARLVDIMTVRPGKI